MSQLQSRIRTDVLLMAGAGRARGVEQAELIHSEVIKMKQV